MIILIESFSAIPVPGMTDRCNVIFSFTFGTELD